MPQEFSLSKRVPMLKLLLKIGITDRETVNRLQSRLILVES